MEFPNGFLFAGVACGIKQSGNDLGLIVSEENCVSAGVYTQNIVRAACIDFNRKNTPMGNCRAIVVNSGNANACTGQTGMENCLATADTVAQKIGCSANQVLVLSTGIIGKQLSMEKILCGIEAATSKLACDQKAFGDLSESFLTTDRFQKTSKVPIKTTEHEFGLVGIAKGAGMIGPNMATMLAVLMTDFPLNQEQAQNALPRAVGKSFNRISVDGHTSTNDAVILLSSANPSVSVGHAEMDEFQNSLDTACIDLAKMIPTDGEGASHLIEVTVQGADSDAKADRIARTIANSNLVKTAVSGNDPNWGRIVSAVGYAGVDLNPAEISLRINEMFVFKYGAPVSFDEKSASLSIKNNTTTSIQVSIGEGDFSSVHWTSDLTTDYVVLNSEYRT